MDLLFSKIIYEPGFDSAVQRTISVLEEEEFGFLTDIDVAQNSIKSGV